MNTEKFIRQVSPIKMKNSKLSCFKNFVCYAHKITLSDIIKAADWGSNRVIKQQGFRILPVVENLKPIKSWKRVNDPHFQIQETSYISQPKGQSIIVIHI